MNAHRQINLQKRDIVRKWEESGLLNNYDGSRKNIAELLESEASKYVREETLEVSVEQTISYLENNLIKARTPAHQLRVAYQLIILIASNIRKKHCL